MRKLFLLGLAVLLLGSCDLLMNKCNVRFANFTHETFLNGIRFGDAQYIGVVGFGFTSDYYLISAGSFALQNINGTGQWIDATDRTFPTSAGNNYTLKGTGDYAPYTWTLIQDP